MEGITKEQLKQDIETINEIAMRYRQAVYGETTIKAADYEQQPKMVRVALPCVMSDLFDARYHLERISDFIIED